MRLQQWISSSSILLLSSIVPTLAVGFDDHYQKTRLLSLRDEHVVLWEDGMLQRNLDRMVDMEVHAPLVKRMPQAAGEVEPTVIANNLTGADPADIDQVRIDAVLSEACAQGVPLIEEVTNDAGLLGCYNVPFLNTWTGAFSADLKLYQVTQPTGDFEGVQPEEIQVALTYSNSAFSVVPKDPQMARRQAAKPNDARQEPTGPGPGGELQTFLFVGQINDSLALDKLEDKDLMALVIPSISISAASQSSSNSDNQNITAPLDSSSIWFFVAGVFEGQNDLGAAAANPEAGEAAAKLASEFVLPGTTLGIFPTGLIITVVWTLLFLLAVGYGTWARVQFRDQFRQRKARADVRGFGVGAAAGNAGNARSSAVGSVAGGSEAPYGSRI